MTTAEFWPEKGIQRCDWLPVNRDSAPFGLSGDSIAVAYGEPHFTLSVSVAAPPGSQLARDWSTFMRRRKGRQVTFSANRPFQSFPVNPAIVSDSTLAVAASDRAASTVTLSGPDSTLSQPSDMIGFFTANSGFYVGEIVTALGGGTFEVWPPPFNPHASTANPRRIKALGEFRMDGDFAPKEAHDGWSLRCTATQVIRK